MNNEYEYKLGIYIYTDGDIYIDKYKDIELYTRDDDCRYQLVKTWKNFEDALNESLDIVKFIKHNIKGDDYVLNKILCHIDNLINSLESLKITGHPKQQYFGKGAFYHSNQDIEICFTNYDLDYELVEYALWERLEEYISTLDENDMHKKYLNEILKGKNIKQIKKENKYGIL